MCSESLAFRAQGEHIIGNLLPQCFNYFNCLCYFLSPGICSVPEFLTFDMLEESLLIFLYLWPIALQISFEPISLLF